MPGNDAFESLVREYYSPLYRFAVSLTHSESDADDLTQQTFYTWATKGHQLRDVAKTKTWLFTTLYREYLRTRRRQTRFPHHELDEVANDLPIVLPDGANQVERASLVASLEAMDDTFREPVALFYLEEVSYKDIAEILDIPLGTVKSRIARGVAMLKRQVAETSRSHPQDQGGPTA